MILFVVNMWWTYKSYTFQGVDERHKQSETALSEACIPDICSNIPSLLNSETERYSVSHYFGSLENIIWNICLFFIVAVVSLWIKVISLQERRMLCVHY